MANSYRSMTYGQPGRYRASGITLTDGQGAALALDASGNLKVVTSGTGSTTVQGTYNATPPTLSDGATSSMQLDQNGNLKITEATLLAGEDLSANVLGTILKPVASSTYSPTTYQNAGTVTKANIKPSAGSCYYFRFSNANAAVRYFQLHNKATAPAAGETAQLYFIIPAGTATVPAVVKIDVTEFVSSEWFTTGLGWAVSTTATTFTDSATAADHITMVRYV